MTTVKALVRVGQDSLPAVGEDNFVDLRASKRGEAVTIDFYTAMILEGRGYQIKAGTISTPIVADVAITDLNAELCVDVPQGTLAIITFANISIVEDGSSTSHEYAIKTVDVVSSAGTVFVPLLLLGDSNGAASQATGRAQTAGSVIVSAELATTTRRLWSYSNPVAIGAGHELVSHDYDPRCPHAIANDACCYMQIASAVTTVPSYFASLDFLELPWVSVS